RDIGVRFEPESRGRESIPLEVVAAGEKVDHHKAPQRLADVELPIYDRFHATRTARIPAAYLVPAELTHVVALLRRHGATVERFNEEWRGEAEAFAIDELVVSTSRFQGGRLTRLEGRFETHSTAQPLGSFLVPTAQPLGTLIAVL